MSLIFAESFDSGNPMTVPSNSGRYHTSSALWGTPQAAYGRHGNGWGQETNSQSQATLYRPLSPHEQDDLLILGHARRIQATTSTTYNHPLAWFYGDANWTSTGIQHLLFYWNAATQAIDVYKGNSITFLGSSTVITTNVWHYFEFRARLSDTVGTVDIRVDGINVLSIGADTRNGGISGLFSMVGISNYFNSAFGRDYVDDIYVVNEQGTTNNDFLGDVRVEALLPNADGANSGLTPHNYNRLPSVNVSGIETDATGWVVETNATIARVTTPVHAGLGSTGALRVTATANGVVVVKTAIGTGGAQVRNGYSYFPALFGRADTTGRNYQIAIDWYDAAGAYLSRSPLNITSVDTTVYAVKSGALAVAPNTASFASLVVQIDDCVAGEIHYLDDASISEAAALPDPGANPSATHYLAVSDIAVSAGSIAGGWDMSYLLGEANDLVDTWGFTNPASPVGKPVKGVVVYASARADTPSAKSLAVVARGTGGVEAVSPDMPLSQTWPGGVSAGFDVDPGDGAWTVTSLGAAEFGIMVRP